MDKDKQITPFNKEFAELQERSELVNSTMNTITKEFSQVELLVSKIIELARYPDFRATQIAEEFNEIMNKFDSFDNVNKRYTVYFLMDFLNHLLVDGEE